MIAVKKTPSYKRSSWVCTCGAVNAKHRNECRKCRRPETEATKHRYQPPKRGEVQGGEE